MTPIMNTMLVALTVLSIDENNRSKVKFTLTDSNAVLIDENTLDDVFVSGLLKYRFDNTSKFNIGQEYVSENNSKNYEACPLKLIRTSDKNNKLIFVLQVVNQGIDTVQTFVTPSGKFIKNRFFKTIPPSEWLRYSDYYDYSIKKRAEKKKQAEAIQS